jgi:hypothetical protein
MREVEILAVAGDLSATATVTIEDDRYTEDYLGDF